MNTKFDAEQLVYDHPVFGEFGGVNPSIEDSATFTFFEAEKMLDTFKGETKGCFLYSRHWNPTTMGLANSVAYLEQSEAAWCTASGMGAITSAILQICNTGDHIVACRTLYGGSYAFLKNYLLKFNITTTFVDITNLQEVENAIKPNTKIIYTETLNNPLLEVSDIKSLSKIAKKHSAKLLVDNTFTPIIISPTLLGADVVLYSATKFINGANDTLAGIVCSTQEFIDSLIDVNNGTAMLLGPVMDSWRAASIRKNLHTLHIRMKQHSKNAMYVAENLEKMGIKIHYPGLKSHKQHNLMTEMMNKEFGYGGMLVIDVGTFDKAAKLMEEMQNEKVGYLAVSLGFYKTLFSSPGKSTSSEVPEEVQKEIGLTEGLVRMSVGLDNDIENTMDRITKCLEKLKLV